MDKRRDISKNKLASGLLGVAAASGLVAASLGGVPTANATCLSISGIGNGNGCFSTLGSFALGLGPNTVATAGGLLAFAIATGLGNGETEITQAASLGSFNLASAGGPDTLAQANGNLGLAVVQGENARAQAGNGTPFDILDLAINFGNGLDTPPPLGGATGNPSLDPQTNAVSAFGPGNIAANISGNSIPGEGVEGVSTVQAGGVTVMPLAVGFADAAYNLFGDGNQVAAGDQGSDFGLAFSVFGDRNDVVVNGPLAAGGALLQSDRSVVQVGPGLEINGVANDTGSTTSVLAAGGTQGSPSPLNSTGSSTNVLAAGNPNRFTPTTFATGSNNNVLAAGGTQGSLFRPGLNAAFNRLKATSPGGSVLRSVSDRFTTSAKNFSDTVSRVTGGLVGGPKAGAASTSSSDE